MHQLFIELKKACDLGKREVLYNIFIEFGKPMNLIRLIKMCLDETSSRMRVSKHLSDMFPIGNGLKQGDVITRVHINQDDLKLNCTHQLLVYAEDVNILGGHVIL